MKLFFEMEVIDERGRSHGKIRKEIHEDAAFIGTRAVGELKMGAEVGIHTISFDEAVHMMQVKQLRKAVLMQVAAQCGAALAEHMEDREGWHGVDRQERVAARYPKYDFL